MIKKGTIYIILMLGVIAASAQTYNKKIADYIKNVENPYSFLSKIENLGIKMSGTSGLDSACKWLMKISTDLGYTPMVNKFLNNFDTLKNIELTKKGENDSCILVCAHYDSWVGKGVNDNGTGCFAVYQMAKLLKSIKSKYTIKFIYFSGEEIGYKGSYDYVSKIKYNNIKVKYMLNFDQLGGTVGQDNSRVKCEKDDQSSNKSASENLTLKIANSYSIYTTLTPQVSFAFLSDYIPFIDSGYVISGVYQYASYPFTHTADDLLKNVELTSLTETVKGALAALIFLSEANDSDLVGIKKTPEILNINVYTTNNVLILDNIEGFSFKIIDNTGRQIYQNIVKTNHEQISIDKLSDGIYHIIFQKELFCVTKKIFLQRK